MAWSGGTYSLYGSYLAISGQTISSTDYNGTAEDLETALNDMYHNSLSAITTVQAVDTIPIYDNSGATSANITLPNFYKSISVLTAETAPAVADVVAIYDDSASAAKKMTLPNLWGIINGFTAETSLANDDIVPIYDTSNTAIRKMTTANFFDGITNLTAETAPATDDELLLRDTSGTEANKITLANMLKVINALTADGSPDLTADYVVTYDASATAAKKVLLEDVGKNWTEHPSSPFATTSGTSVDATSIPSGVNKICVYLDGVSLDATVDIHLQLGDSGGVEATGYTSGYLNDGGTDAATTGFNVRFRTDATKTAYAKYELEHMGSNVWVCSWTGYQDGVRAGAGAGGKTLSAELDRIRLTTSSGTDNFDAGQMKVEWYI